MKIQTVQRVAQVEGSISSTSFGIATNAKMISILSDKLYSNKIRAVIRELSTNAWDSHKDAGHQKPFDIHLPTILEPFFYIRDYGTGMSEETFNKVYVWYGSSTKDQSNEFTGCLGLGSKTPFCYNTKTATITVWYGGRKRIYTLYPNDEGMPKADLVSDTASSEPNGVQIMLSVDRYEYEDFVYEAEDIYQYFPVCPNFVGKQAKVSKPEYTFEGTGWGMNSNAETTVVMGNVAYPVNVKNMKLDTPTQTHILTKGFEIYVDIGEVDIQPSREGLEYNNLTKIHLLNRVNNIIKEAGVIAEQKIKDAKSLWEARIIANKLMNLGDIFNAVDFTNLTWNGMPLGINTFGRIDIANYVVPVSTSITIDDTITITKYEQVKWRNKQTRRENCQFIVLTESIYVNDLKIGYIGRIEYKCKSDGDLYCINIGKDADPVKVQLLKDYLGLSDTDLKKTSSLPCVSNPTRTGSGIGRMSRVVELNQNPGYKRITQNWTNTTIDLNNGGIYVEFNRYRIVGFCFDTLNKIFKKLRGSRINITIPPIYGIKTQDIKDLGSNWKPLSEWLSDQYELLYIKHGNKLEQCLSYKNELDQFNRNYRLITTIEFLSEFNIPDICSLNLAKKIAEKGVDDLGFYQELEYIGTSIGVVKTPQPVNKLNLGSRIADIVKKYKILTKLDTSFCKENRQIVLDYINFVNQGVSNVSV